MRVLIKLRTIDLPVVSPLSHAITRTMNQWCTWLQKQLELAGPAPPNFIPGCVVENAPTGPPILKYRSLLDPNNTPFAYVNDHLFYFF